MRILAHTLPFLALLACNTSSGGGQALGLGDPGGFDQQAVCEAPLCGNARFGLDPAEPPPDLHLAALPSAEAAWRVRQAFARGEEGARLLARAAADGTFTPETRAWVVGGLDAVVPGWRAVPAEAPVDEPGVATGRYALDTTGCGNMSLRLELAGVTVVERDDNFADDRVYCLVQARDEQEVEVLHTEVTSALGPGERAWFQDSVMYGRAAPKDPGRELALRYDCWEHDSSEDYDDFREAVRAIEQLGKAIGSTTVLSVAKASRIIIELAAALDGDDHLYTADERLGRQALWAWINERDRTISAGGTHLGSDWSWKLHFTATGCALGVADAPRPPAGEACGPSNCAGCCSGGRCQPGGDEQACGRGGGACASCGSGELCSSGACRFDDNATFSLTVLYAEVAFTKANGDCWDDIFGGCDDPPDPYLEASSGGRSGRTGLERNTWSPDWSSTVLQGVRARDLMNRVTFEVTDDDLQFDDLIGRCSFAMSASELQTGGPFSIECGQSVVTFEVAPQ